MSKQPFHKNFSRTFGIKNAISHRAHQIYLAGAADAVQTEWTKNEIRHIIVRMKILFLIHSPFEMPGAIESWAAEKGYEQIYCSPYAGEKIPRSCDFIVAMGGPQSPLALDKDPYLRDEIALLRDAMKARIPVLGFCLGAQLIGEALGARTERSPFKEVGVFPIELTEEGVRDPLLAKLPKNFLVSHWHNDMPGLTKDAAVLAKSAGCPRQIVRYSPLAYGFQCHPEITLQLAEGLVKNCPEDLAASKYVQSAQEILAHDFAAINRNMVQMLDHFLAAIEVSIF
jgi:GMP synthase (glutamine-hydrolysing)